MHEELITFETAKLAKEKRFENTTYSQFTYYHKASSSGGKCIPVGTIEPNNNFCKNEPYNNKSGLENYSRPTQSLLQKWLREGLAISNR